MTMLTLPRATLRDLAVRASVSDVPDWLSGGPIGGSFVTLMAETLIDSLDSVDDSNADDASDLAAYVKELKEERDRATEEENDTIRDLRKEVDDLTTDRDKLASDLADARTYLEQARKAPSTLGVDALKHLESQEHERLKTENAHLTFLDAARAEARRLDGIREAELRAENEQLRTEVLRLGACGVQVAALRDCLAGIMGPATLSEVPAPRARKGKKP